MARIPIKDQPNHNTNGLDKHPENINTKGKEAGTHDFATLIQMAFKARGKKEEARYIIAKQWVRILLSKTAKDSDKLKAMKELTDRFEGPITQVMEVNDTRPQINLKTKKAVSEVNKMKDM